MFDQSPNATRVEWGLRGAREAADRGDITIIVDVLRFSSTVVTAVHHGAIIYPHPKNEDVQAFAAKLQAELSPTLSSLSYGPLHAGNKYVLCSLNGAVCAWTALHKTTVLIGCLLNAQAVAAVANHLQINTGRNISVIPCGELWYDVHPGENQLRPAIEDYLGAGAILSQLKGTQSPEAEVCIQAFINSEHSLTKLIRECGSTRELRARGSEVEVDYCSQLNIIDTVPINNGDYFIQYKPINGG